MCNMNHFKSFVTPALEMTQDSGASLVCFSSIKSGSWQQKRSGIQMDSVTRMRKHQSSYPERLINF